MTGFPRALSHGIDTLDEADVVTPPEWIDSGISHGGLPARVPRQAVR
jgi:hypothetical protein